MLSQRSQPPSDERSRVAGLSARPTRVAVYARVSTSDQNADAQLIDLRVYAKRRGWEIAEEYVDHGVSGTREKRPALDQLMDDARRRKFDVVAVWRFDRFARSTKHLVLALEEFDHVGITFVSVQENLDLGSPMGRAMYTIIGAIAALEREIIAERVRSGLRRARTRGKRLGRRPAVLNIDKALRLRADGLSLRDIGARLGVSKDTISKCLRNPRAAA